MTRTVWLASYPKSGNTWLRILIANLSASDAGPVDINRLPDTAPTASARMPFDDILLIESGVLSPDEADILRPRVYEILARRGEAQPESQDVARFAKVHDAYLLTRAGEPLLAGSRGAEGAVVIVRDPRDVVLSLANHSGISVDEAIAFVNDSNAGLCTRRDRQHDHLRQRLSNWSGHIGSWLDQRDIPIHLVRYEDLLTDTTAVLARVLSFAGRNATAEALARATAFSGFAELRRQESERGFREGLRHDGRFFRRGVAGGWREDLTAGQVESIEAAHGPMMRRLGYAPSSATQLGLEALQQ